MRERKNLMSVGQVAEIFGVTAATVRRWCREGKLKEYLRTVGNHRRFREEDYRHLLPGEERGRKTVGYARVQVMIRKAIFRLRRKDSGDMDVMKSSWILEAGLIAKSQDSES